MSIIDGFLLHAKHQPAAPAICAPGWNYDIVSYGRLLVFANNVAAHALAAGLKRGDVVGIFAKRPDLSLGAHFGIDAHRRRFPLTVNPNLPSGLRSRRLSPIHRRVFNMPAASSRSIRTGSRATANRPAPRSNRAAVPLRASS